MQFSKETLKGIAEVVVLKSLEGNDAYGYELVTRIAATSENIFEFQEGTVYPLLYRLEDRGDVRSYGSTTANGKTRRYYAITPQGKKLLRSRSNEYRSLISGLTRVLNFSYVI